MSANYLDAIRGFEGFTPKAEWDYAQHTNGYGTKAKYAGEVIDKAEADRRFHSEIANARAIVEKHAPGATEGTKQALTSLTFNAGDKWTRSGLGEAIRSGDTDKAKEIFLQYNKAGGEVLPGLVSRRVAEAAWIGQPGGDASSAGQPVTVTSTGQAFAQAVPPAPVPANAPPPMQVAEADLSTADAVKPSEAPEVPMTDEEAEAELLSKIRTAVASLPGEARMTQLLLASQFIEAPSADKVDDAKDAGSTKGLLGA